MHKVRGVLGKRVMLCEIHELNMTSQKKLFHESLDLCKYCDDVKHYIVMYFMFSTGPQTILVCLYILAIM